jgi:hypothetical protein
MQRLLYRKTIKGQNLNRNEERGWTPRDVEKALFIYGEYEGNSSKHLKRTKLTENKRRELCNWYDTDAGSELYRLFEIDLKEAVK